MKTPTLLCLTFLFSSLQIFRATAAQGFFSPDGKTVTMVFNGKLATVDIPSGQFSPIELPPAFDNVDEPIHSVAKGGKGEILFLARDAVWSLKSGEAPQKVCSTVPLLGPHDLFVVTQADSPWKDWLFVSAVKEDDPFHGDRATFRALKPGGDSFGSIFCHRVDNAVAGCFTPDGRFFFSSSGDLWEGARFRVGRVNITGNTKTEDKVIRREITLKPGDWFNPVELEAAKARLTSLGLFREVNISGSERDPGFRDVEVLVEEASPFDALDAAIDAKDWRKAGELVDEIAQAEPEMAVSIRFGLAVMKKDSVEAAQQARVMADGEIKDDAEGLNDMAWELATEFKNPGKELLEAASYIIKKAVELNREEPAVLDTLARIQFLQGLKDEAVKTLEKAIAKAGDEDLKSQLKLSLESMKKGELPKIKQDEMESGGE